MRLESLGWNSLYQSQVTQFERENYVPARVSEEQKNYFRLLSEPGEYIAEVSGKLRYGAEDRDDLPTVGDWVLAHVRPHEGRATIHRILPRRSKLSRKTAGDKTSEQIVAALQRLGCRVIREDQWFVRVCRGAAIIQAVPKPMVTVEVQRRILRALSTIRRKTSPRSFGP